VEKTELELAAEARRNTLKVIVDLTAKMSAIVEKDPVIPSANFVQGVGPALQYLGALYETLLKGPREM
jgi:hypothetical protein